MNKSPVGVVGLGRSGVAAIEFLRQQGVTVVAWDCRPEAGEAVAQWPGVTVLPETLAANAFCHCQALLLSPGVRRDMPELQGYGSTLPIINDVEWLFRHVVQHTPSTPFIGITGTNGKSTVTTLVGKMLEASGLSVQVGGNLGTPALSLWDQQTSAYVLELSSFQLESVTHFRPRVAALLNLTADHLDRYATEELYLQAKCQIFSQQGAGDWAVINQDDPLLAETIARLSRSDVGLLPFSIQQPTPGGVYAWEGKLIDHRGKHPEPLLELQQIKLAGQCNQSNAAAAAAIALAAGASAQGVVDTLRQFPGLPHRMAWVRTIRGISYYNDSKGTNVGAVQQSIQSFPNKIVLIAGGRDKNGDFAALTSLIKKHVSALILLGEAAAKIEKTLMGTTNLYHVRSLEEAVQLSSRLAKPGETVLLSPACASFDMFRNFEDRGERFQEAVYALQG